MMGRRRIGLGIMGLLCRQAAQFKVSVMRVAIHRRTTSWEPLSYDSRSTNKDTPTQLFRLSPRIQNQLVPTYPPTLHQIQGPLHALQTPINNLRPSRHNHPTLQSLRQILLIKPLPQFLTLRHFQVPRISPPPAFHIPWDRVLTPQKRNNSIVNPAADRGEVIVHEVCAAGDTDGIKDCSVGAVVFQLLEDGGGGLCVVYDF